MSKEVKEVKETKDPNKTYETPKETPKDQQDPQKVDLQHYQNSQDKQDTQETAQQEGEKKKGTGTLSVQMAQTVAILTAKGLPEEYQAPYVKDYMDFTLPWLISLDFDSAMGAGDLSDLPPLARLGIGAGIMVAGALIVRPKILIEGEGDD